MDHKLIWNIEFSTNHYESVQIIINSEISVTKVFITANMKNSKSRSKQEVDVR